MGSPREYSAATLRSVVVDILDLSVPPLLSNLWLVFSPFIPRHKSSGAFACLSYEETALNRLIASLMNATEMGKSCGSFRVLSRRGSFNEAKAAVVLPAVVGETMNELGHKEGLEVVSGSLVNREHAKWALAG